MNSEKLFRNLIEKIPDPILVVNFNKVVRFFNPAAESLLGYETKELIGAPFKFPLDKKKKSNIEIILENKTKIVAEIKNVEIRWEGEKALLLSIRNVTKREQELKKIARSLVQSNISLKKEITQKVQIQSNLESLARCDSLTGLPNQLFFKEKIELAINRSLRRNERLAILLLDIDHFKNVNNTLGHPAGDRLLVETAERIKGCMRDGDTLTRRGGDEFCILLENISNPHTVAGVAQRIINVFKKPFSLNDNEIWISASIGITFFPTEGKKASELIRNADIAMYQVKNEGRKNYKFFTPEMEKQVSKKVTLSNQLHDALEKNEFRLYYQPQMDVINGRIVGVEALLRWQHPEKGLIPPDVFIPLLEETGLIGSVSEWVLKEACAQNRAWQDRGLPSIKMAVNFSPRHFRDKNLAVVVKRILEETGMDPRFLEVEITENLFIENKGLVSETLKQFKAMGVGMIVMDDFGIGYSSISYLKQFPIDRIKIDKSFIRNILTDPEDNALVSAIIAMAHALGLDDIVAEGVEDKAQIPVLRQMGCHICQGYLFSRPVPADKMEKLLETQTELMIQ
ncbi:MAG: EAL domain-containing protein [Deltaproteobacteria bacterium]|nr:EAL domain-containing protein [Deltaproteobacteria bacterium]